MCPECVMSAGWILSGAISTGGVSAMAVRIICAKKRTTDSRTRRKDDGYGDERKNGCEGGDIGRLADGTEGTAGKRKGVHAPARWAQSKAALNAAGQGADELRLRCNR